MEKLDGKDLFMPNKDMRNSGELDYEKLGNKIRVARKEANMTLPELAMRLGMSEAYISRIERGL